MSESTCHYLVSRSENAELRGILRVKDGRFEKAYTDFTIEKTIGVERWAAIPRRMEKECAPTDVYSGLAKARAAFAAEL